MKIMHLGSPESRAYLVPGISQRMNEFFVARQGKRTAVERVHGAWSVVISRVIHTSCLIYVVQYQIRIASKNVRDAFLPTDEPSVDPLWSSAGEIDDTRRRLHQQWPLRDDMIHVGVRVAMQGVVRHVRDVILPLLLGASHFS